MEKVPVALVGETAEYSVSIFGKNVPLLVQNNWGNLTYIIYLIFTKSLREDFLFPILQIWKPSLGEVKQLSSRSPSWEEAGQILTQDRFES